MLFWCLRRFCVSRQDTSIRRRWLCDSFHVVHLHCFTVWLPRFICFYLFQIGLTSSIPNIGDHLLPAPSLSSSCCLSVQCDIFGFLVQESNTWKKKLKLSYCFVFFYAWLNKSSCDYNVVHIYSLGLFKPIYRQHGFHTVFPNIAVLFPLKCTASVTHLTATAGLGPSHLTSASSLLRVCRLRFV